MKFKSIAVAVLFSLVFSVINAQKPTLFLVKPERLAAIKNQLKAGDAQTKAWVNHLVKDANKYLTARAESVTDKKQVPAGGDKHDYMSLAPYYWPDPSNPTGPYIRKDGQRNPEMNEISDHKAIDNTTKAVKYLCLAYYFSNDEAYAKKASELLHVFFLDAATKMNPNMKYAQAVKGVNDGRGTGILDSRSFVDVVSYIGLLDGSKAWTTADKNQLKNWFSEYYDWLSDSKNGKDERNAKNNHGIWFDTQMLGIGLFLGKEAAVKDYLKSTIERIDVQQETDGRQPLELVRTAALSYSTFCLEAWATAATLADNVGVDLWNYKTKDGKGIKIALDWLLPYAMGDKAWTYPQIHDYKKGDFLALLIKASNKYNDKIYLTSIEKLQAEKEDYLNQLLYGK